MSTYDVDVVVTALIPEYEQVKVKDATGRFYTLTNQINGIDLSSFYEGQKLTCTVSYPANSKFCIVTAVKV